MRTERSEPGYVTAPSGLPVADTARIALSSWDCWEKSQARSVRHVSRVWFRSDGKGRAWIRYGSLGLTGFGHGTDRAVVLGLLGEEPGPVGPARIEGLVRSARESNASLLWAARQRRSMKPATCSFAATSCCRAIRMACALRLSTALARSRGRKCTPRWAAVSSSAKAD